MSKCFLFCNYMKVTTSRCIDCLNVLSVLDVIYSYLLPYRINKEINTCMLMYIHTENVYLFNDIRFI